MLEKGRISALQSEFMMIPAIIATAVLTIPSIDSRFAGHDMWMTPIFGSVVGFLTVYIVWKLHELYPQQTPIQYSEKIIGKVGGRLFGLLLVLFYIHNTGILVREYADFIKGNVMLETPRVVFSILMLFAAALAVRGGLEVIARAAVICTTLFMSTSVVLLLLIKEIDLGYMLPFLENGFLPVMKGVLIHNSWFSEFFLFAFILPFLDDTKKGLKSGMRASFLLMLILFYVNFFVLTLIGTAAENQFYPVYAIVQSISLLDFFENFEVVITASWVLGNFVKTSVFLYVACLAFSQLFRLSNYRVVVFPLSLISLYCINWDLPNLVVQVSYISKIQPFYLITIQTIFPLILLMIALGKKKWSGRT
jgi:spore germination protein KB